VIRGFCGGYCATDKKKEKNRVGPTSSAILFGSDGGGIFYSQKDLFASILGHLAKVNRTRTPMGIDQTQQSACGVKLSEKMKCTTTSGDRDGLTDLALSMIRRGKRESGGKSGGHKGGRTTRFRLSGAFFGTFLSLIRTLEVSGRIFQRFWPNKKAFFSAEATVPWGKKPVTVV